MKDNNFRSKPMRIITGMLLLAAGSAAQAAIVTVDFDSTLPTYFGLASYQEDGITLNSNVPDGTLIDTNDLVRSNLGIFSGGTSSQSIFWGANGQTSTISLADDLGRQFDLLALDASSLYNASGQITVTGTKFGGGTVSQTVSLTSSLATYNFATMTDLSSVAISFDGNAYYAPFDMDNIQLSVIPIPAAVWMFVSALGVLGLRSRARSGA
jgi:hypothetical protein